MARTNLDDTQIRETAYLFWLNEGQPSGQDERHWMQAIDALTKAQPKAKPARKAAAKPRKAKIVAKPAAKPKAKAKTASK
ncbi:MAG: DUF2934 domain-containing protein [Sulfitobacter sp.]